MDYLKRIVLFCYSFLYLFSIFHDVSCALHFGPLASTLESIDVAIDVVIIAVKVAKIHEDPNGGVLRNKHLPRTGITPNH